MWRFEGKKVYYSSVGASQPHYQEMVICFSDQVCSEIYLMNE